MVDFAAQGVSCSPNSFVSDSQLTLGLVYPAGKDQMVEKDLNKFAGNHL
jgi:hypothetical protein